MRLKSLRSIVEYESRGISGLGPLSLIEIKSRLRELLGAEFEGGVGYVNVSHIEYFGNMLSKTKLKFFVRGHNYYADCYWLEVKRSGGFPEWL